MRPIVLAALATLITACASAPQLGFRPTVEAKLEDAPGDIAGKQGASYPVLHGEVKVAALGISVNDLPARIRHHWVRALHVRLVVYNGGHEDWTVDVHEQIAFLHTLDDEDIPLAAATAGDDTTLAVLLPKDTRTLDLYYPLPKTLRDGRAIARIRVDWRISTPSREFAAHETPFERYELPRPKDPAAPKRPTKLAEPDPHDDGLPRPGSAEPSAWSSWRD
jgi:hypothetical protein